MVVIHPSPNVNLPYKKTLKEKKELESTFKKKKVDPIW